MPVKKKGNWKNFFSFLSFAITYVIIVSLLIAIPIRVANYFHLHIYAGLIVFLLFFAHRSAFLISNKLFGIAKPRPLFTNFRDGVVISFAWLIFLLIAFSAFDIKGLPSYLCMISFPIAIFVAVSFTYLFGTDELRLKIRKMFKKKRVRKPKQEKTNDRPIDS